MAGQGFAVAASVTGSHSRACPVVAGGGEQQLSAGAGAERHRVHAAGVAGQRVAGGAPGRRVPQPDRPVPAARGEQELPAGGGAERHRAHSAACGRGGVRLSGAPVIGSQQPDRPVPVAEASRSCPPGGGAERQCVYQVVAGEGVRAAGPGGRSVGAVVERSYRGAFRSRGLADLLQISGVGAEILAEPRPGAPIDVGRLRSSGTAGDSNGLSVTGSARRGSPCPRERRGASRSRPPRHAGRGRYARTGGRPPSSAASVADTRRPIKRVIDGPLGPVAARFPVALRPGAVRRADATATNYEVAGKPSLPGARSSTT